MTSMLDNILGIGGLNENLGVEEFPKVKSNKKGQRGETAKKELNEDQEDR